MSSRRKLPHPYFLPPPPKSKKKLYSFHDESFNLSTISLKNFHLFKIIKSVYDIKKKKKKTETDFPVKLTQQFWVCESFLVEWWTNDVIHHENSIIFSTKHPPLSLSLLFSLPHYHFTKTKRTLRVCLFEGEIWWIKTLEKKWEGKLF